MRAIGQYFPVVLFIMLYKVILTFESVDEIIKCDHSNESYWTVLSCGAVYHAVQGGSNFWVCGWNHKVWPWTGLKKRIPLCMLWFILILGSNFIFLCFKLIGAIFVCPWKMVLVSVRYLFYQPMFEKKKTWTLRFPAKENPNMEKALSDWQIVLQYDVKAISRKFFGHEVFSAKRSLNQPKARRVSIRSINQSNRSISVLLLFLFCSRVFISRSYENRSIIH